tara:strand:+ start:9604 stop:9912 length:309 start_codon:yes stop_codon:yes gene_type:complete
MLLITNNRCLNKILNIVLLFFVIFIIFSAIFVSNVNLLNESFTNKEKKTKHDDEDAFKKDTEFSEPVPLKRALKAFSDFHIKELRESRKHHERNALESVAYH